MNRELFLVVFWLASFVVSVVATQVAAKAIARGHEETGAVGSLIGFICALSCFAGLCVAVVDYAQTLPSGREVRR